MNAFFVNIKGKAHNGINSECEDAIYIDEKNGIFCLADGVSNSKYGKKGAECLVNNLGKAFASSDYKKHLRNADPNSIRRKICSDFNKLLNKLCEEYMCDDTNLFASTFIALIMTDNKEATIIHAGDGTVFAKPSSSKCAGSCILSYPDNSESGSVYSAGHPEQKDRIRVLRIKTSDYSKVILSTDGFSDAYLIPSYQAFDADSLSCVFMAENADDINAIIKKKHFDERNITDDISCIVCSFDDPLAIKSSDNLPGISRPIEEKGNSKIKQTNSHCSAEAAFQTPIVKTGSGAKLKNIGINITFNVMCLLIIVSLVMTSAFWLYECKESNDKLKNQEKQICLLNDELVGFEEKIQNLENEINTIKTKTETDAETETSNEETSEKNFADEWESDDLINETPESQSSLE